MMNFERNLYRGKRVDNGEWVEGYLILKGNQTFISSFPYFVGKVHETNWLEFCFGGFIEVIPETVGQYIGLNDKNETKIFEQDIIEYPIEYGGYKGENIHEVVFENRHSTAYFGIKMSNIETWGFDMEVPAKLMKVIGNIHDNPDLLGGDD